jgi:hypothetical protein
MTWFETLTGVKEVSPEHVRQYLAVEGRRLHSRVNGKSWLCGELETPSLAELRAATCRIDRKPNPLSVREVVANVQQLHQDPYHANAMFQVASQFNLLEMTSPAVTPELGVGIYENDFTQGPACAIAAGAGTIYRNYFAVVNGQIGQNAENQIDCLASIGALLGNTGQRLWEMKNGYALPSSSGLKEINRKLGTLDEPGLDQIRQALRIGLQWGTQVTLEGCDHTVSQAYCSAMPVAYTGHTLEPWAPFATLVLEAAYEAAICAANLNAHRTGNDTLFLTLLGGGAFGNRADWIMHAIRRSLKLHADCGLDVAIVSFGRSTPCIQDLIREYSSADRDENQR